VATAQRAAALRAAGVAVLDFSVGEPDQQTPRRVLAAAAAALRAGRTKYAPASGLPELRAAVAARYRKDFGLSFSAEEVGITVGGKQALYLACQVLLDRGDEVVIPAPYWPTFPEAVRLAGARPVFVHAREEDGFKVTARMIGRATSPRTKAVILNSPANPTGAILEPGELRSIGHLAARRRLFVLYDDTYAHLTYGRSRTPALEQVRRALRGRLVVVGTTSKSYCMTGWRIGWVLGSRSVVDACAALASHSTQSPTTFAQAGAVVALTGSQGFVRELAAEYRRRRDLIHRALTAIPGVTCVEPEGAFYVFPNVSRCLGPDAPSTLELCLRLLEERKVATVAGEGFGAPGYLRISFARSRSDLREGARRIAAFLHGR
jgi:aspartate aminotransferase